MTSFAKSVNHRSQIGGMDTLALGINGVIGSGIFFLPSVGDKLLGPAALVATLLAGCLAFWIASAFANVARDYEHNGGSYLYTRRHFGDWPGFVVGWMTWLVAVISWGALLNALFLALEGLYSGFSDLWVKRIGMSGLVFALVFINVYGIAPGAKLSTLLTLLKVSPLVVLGFFGVSEVDVSRFENFSPYGWGDFADATLLILYAYVGFESLVVPAGEIRNSRSTLPKILPRLIIGVTVLYLLLQLVCIGTLESLSSRTNPIADSALSVFGPTIGTLFLWVSVVSVLGVNAGTALVTPRRLSSMAEEGDAPALMGRYHPRYHTPIFAISLTGVAALGFALSGSFEELALLSVVARFVQYLPTCWISCRKGIVGDVRSPASVTAQSALALIVSLCLLMVADSQKLVAGIAAMAFFSVLYFLRVRLNHLR